MIITCIACGGDGTTSDGESCYLCGGDGEIDLLDSAFKRIKYGQEKELMGYVWSSLLENTTMPTNVFHSYEILEATDGTEYLALSGGNTAMYNALISCGRVDLNDGKKGRTWLWTLFDSESTTRAALTALLS